MEFPSASIPPLFPGIDSAVGRICHRSPASGSRREDFFHTLSRSSLFDSKERYRQETGNPRPVNPQQVYFMPNLQNDNDSRREKSTSGRRICNFNRFEGCVLAYSHRQALQEVPRFPHRKFQIQIPGDALRLEHCAKNVHQDMQANPSGASAQGHRSFSLFGRLANLGAIDPAMSGVFKDCDRDSSKTGFHYKFRKVETSSQSAIRLARDSLEHVSLHPVDSSRKSEGSEKRSQNFSQIQVLDQEATRKGDGEAPIRLISGSFRKSASKIHESPSSSLRSLPQEGLGEVVSQVPQNFDHEMASSRNSLSYSSPSSSSPFVGCLHGRVSGGLGCTFVKRTPASGDLVSDTPNMSHQHSGISCSIPSTKELTDSSTNTCSVTLRQFDSSKLPQQAGFSQVSPSELLGHQYSTIVAEPKVDSVGLSHSRSAQCDRGRPLQVEAPLFGVDVGFRNFSRDLSSDLSSASRPVCDKGEPPITCLCITGARQLSSGHGCLSCRLERLDGNIPVSPGSHDLKSSGSPRELQGEGSSHYAGLAKPSVVPSVNIQVSESFGSSSAIPVAEGRENPYLLLIKQHEHPSMLGFLKKVYADRFSVDTAEILVKAVRDSTANQYHSVWKSFCGFVKDKNPNCITVEFILEYLRFLFKEKKLAPHTVTCYKSALARPLNFAFGIDVSDTPFLDFTKAIFNLRPSKPVTPIRWSLDKVLSFALSPRFQSGASLKDQLAVSLFLVALATGSRSCELSALLRLDSNLISSGDGITLYPNPNFLAKNENPRSRRDPIFIPRLKEEDGGPHPLCPVVHIERFLLASASTKSVQLFVDPVSLGDLSVQKIRLWICKFIRWGDPGSFPLSHDLRKVSSTLAFLRSMSMEEICSVTGWASVRVFRKHYFKSISEVATKLVVVGSQVSPTNIN